MSGDFAPVPVRQTNGLRQGVLAGQRIHPDET
jgi:hypothetical protein